MLIALIGNSAESMLNFRGSLIRRMLMRGHEVIAFAPDYDANSRAAVSALGAIPMDFPLNRGGASPHADFKTLLVLRRKLSKLRPDAVLSYFIKPAIYGNLAAATSGVRRRIVMLEGLGYGFAEAKSPSWRHRAISLIIRALLKLSLSMAQVALVLNDDDRNTLIKRVGIEPTRIVNMGGIGVELDQFVGSPIRGQAATFAMAARLIAEKGVYEYVEAARRIRAENDQIRFLLLGDVDDNPNSLTREQVNAWCEAGFIEWPGRVSNIQNWLNQADVFVLPSYYREGVPRSTQEAMALGRAIITTDHVGCRDTVDDGINGILLPSKDVDALVRAMRSLIDLPGLAQRMGRASRFMAEARFDAAKADDRIIGVLESGRADN